jgi:hypothetical protein
MIGAPKCGTTALYTYLSRHEHVFMPWIKEPHYFATELAKSRVRPINKLDEYLGLFGQCTRQHKVAGEGSVFYLASPNAIQNIHRFNGKAKIIIMVRNPVDMFASLHSQLYFTLDEDHKDIEAAWRAQVARTRGHDIPKTCRIPGILQYRRTCSLGALSQKVLDVFPRDQVKIILFDDFITDTRNVYREVLAFLDVQDDGRVDFSPVNENKVVRLRAMASLYHDKGVLQPFWRAFEKQRNILNVSYNSILHPVYSVMHWLYMKLNTKTVKRFALNPRFQSELRDVFREDVEKLSQIVGRNLGCWLTGLRE